MERLVLLGLCGVVLGSCTPDPLASLDPRFSNAVTALLIQSYHEDPQTRRFVRTSAWGQIPEKLVPDGEGGYSAAVPLLLQTETSEGPLPDRFWTVMVHLVRLGDRFELSPNDALPGPYQTFQNAGRRTVWLIGATWQFQGRY